MNDNRADIWSYGGGVQSVAMVILILQGKLRKPERIIMADTARERQSVWDYSEEVVKPALASIGMELEIAPHDLATVDLTAKNGDLLIPVFFRNEDGGGKLPTYCSNEWKKRVVHRYLRSKGYGKDRPVRMWFGMSLDEVGRMRKSDVGWIENYYPLCMEPTTRMRRHECRLLIGEYGWPQPPSSACWMCPNRDNTTWQEMKENEPEDFAKAVALERELQESGEWGEIYLHGDLVPLDEVDFSKDEEGSLFDECAFSCWT